MKFELNEVYMKFLVFLFPFLIFANPAKRGEEIAVLIEKAGEGYKSETSQMKMILMDAYGKERIRAMRGKVLELKNGSKSISIFDRPADVKGTKMLTWSYQDKEDDQWIYLPSFRRVKRINSRNRSSSYMGSEFNYQDLGSQERERFNYKYLGDENDYWKLQRIKKGESAYSKEILWVHKEKMTVLKTDYYDQGGKLLKKAKFLDYKTHTVNGKTFYRPYRLEMHNLLNQKKSIIEWSERKLGAKVSPRELDKEALK